MVDTSDALHGQDLLQAGLDVAALPTLGDVVRDHRNGAEAPTGPGAVQSCGWAGWDLAAARLALCAMPTRPGSDGPVTATPA